MVSKAVLALVAVVALVALSVFVLPGIQFLAVGGMTVNSISPVGVSVNNGVVTGQYRITVTADHGAESLTGVAGTFDPSLVQSMAGGPLPQNAFTIKIAELKESWNYNVLGLTVKTPIYRIDPVPAAECDKAIGWGIVGAPTGSDYIRCTGFSGLCIKKVQVGWFSAFDNPNTLSQIKVEVSGHGGTKTAVLSNTNPSANLGDIGTFQFTGGLSTGNPTSLPSLYAPYWTGSTSTWKLTSGEKKANYISAFGNEWTTLKACVNSLSSAPTTASIYQWDTTYLNSANTGILKDDITIGSLSGIKVSQSIIGQGTNYAVFSIKPTYETVKPQLVFSINAAWVGIKVDVGKPVISVPPVSPVKFVSGSNAQVVFSVRNQATVPGSFNIGLDASCKNFQQVGYLNSIPFTAGQTQTINNFYIASRGAAMPIQETCNINICEVSGRGGCDTASIFIDMGSPRYCTEGEKSIEGNCGIQCINNAKTNTMCCQNGQTISLINEQFACNGEIPVCSTAADCDDKNPKTVDACVTDIFNKKSCTHTAVACTTAADCDDGNGCTTDTCEAGLLGLGTNHCVNTKIEGCVIPGINMSIIFAILAGAATLGGLYVVYPPRKKKEATLRIATFLVAGIIVSMIVYWILQVQWWQWVLLGGGVWIAVIAAIAILGYFGVLSKIKISR